MKGTYGTYSHHLIGYSPGPPASRPPTLPDITELRRQAVYHLMEYMRTAQNNGHSDANDAQIEIPYHLAKYAELQKLLIDARRLASSPRTAIPLDSPNMLK